ncbi:MAG: ATP-dependent DNA helicase [Oscillospiraceae bacterium]|jgi:DNA excision repair protein ERCC-2|nr:ATP-dependent DNA helicase [Oscillospiraceae bacterium]
MREGAKLHRLLQQMSADGVAERRVSLLFSHLNIDLLVAGRIDRLAPGDPPIVEEFKLASHPVSAPIPEHWTQTVIYAHMLAQSESLDTVRVRLIYAAQNGGTLGLFESVESRVDLEGEFRAAAEPFCAYIAGGLSWRAARDESLRGMRFPYPEPRPGQRAFAAHVRQAIISKRRLFAEAPTGIGKTSAALVPSVRALASGYTEQVFFLTARTTARLAALDALERMRAQGVHLRSVVLTAKELCCPHAREAAGTFRCAMTDCPEAVGFYDRLAESAPDFLRVENATPDAIAAMARSAKLCPHELSLSMAEAADVVLCDYNYAFDPSVQLQRVFRVKKPVTLLIDEAHHLGERARNMLSATVSTDSLKASRREMGQALGRKSEPYAAMTKLIHAMESISTWNDEERLDAPPDALLPALSDALDQSLAALPTASLPVTHNMVRPLTSMRAALTSQTIPFAWLIRRSEPQGNNAQPGARLNHKKHTELTALCLDVAQHIASCTKRLCGCVFFSGTFSPLPAMRSLLGGDNEDALLSLPSPFPPERLLTLWMAHSTRYQARQSSSRAVAETLAAFARHSPGNLWFCFPSYAYLEMIRVALVYVAPELELAVQPRVSGAEAAFTRQSFIDMFQEDTRRIGMIVLGGSFGESVDLPGGRLTGAAVVGVGLPQVNLEQETLRAYYDERFGDGFQAAYRVPGMHKVIQAAGRVIRSSNDKGALLLLDERYGQDDYADLLPAHWTRFAQCDSNEELIERLQTFWEGER